MPTRDRDWSLISDETRFRCEWERKELRLHLSRLKARAHELNVDDFSQQLSQFEARLWTHLNLMDGIKEALEPDRPTGDGLKLIKKSKG